ncbi:hypothetical protein G6O69_15395 [Pseudenhygromyxa sp. WMMC2535]|nr:hypothetical protein [Pseudenhygromyxa sp. WMMC2535]NVB39227.1 hypothetical protein [Pseudenhygromyxa sp. WMMC2535]
MIPFDESLNSVSTSGEAQSMAAGETQRARVFFGEQSVELGHVTFR